MYCKLIDGELVRLKQPIRNADKHIFTTDESVILENGYKLFVEAEIPEYNEETHYLEEYYEDGDEITKKYRVLEIPAAPEV